MTDTVKRIHHGYKSERILWLQAVNNCVNMFIT